MLPATQDQGMGMYVFMVMPQNIGYFPSASPHKQLKSFRIHLLWQSGCKFPLNNKILSVYEDVCQ